MGVENNHGILPYEGKSPYLFVSFEPDDWESISGILELMRDRGLRFWLGNSIPSGLDRDEAIAEHLEGSGCTVAFLSENYLNSLDTMDELNYSRDLNKPLLLVYMKPTQLPAGLEMRIGRLQSLRREDYPDDAALFTAIMQTPGFSHYYGVDDPALAAKVEKLLPRLEALYPDHRVFGLRGIDQTLAENLAHLCAQSEYDTTEDLLRAYGYTRIDGEEAKRSRNVACVPGAEPEAIRPAVENAMNTLAGYYPAKVIGENLQRSHKALHTRLLALHQWLGYEDMQGFLGAYGYQYLFEGKGGRPGRGTDFYSELIGRLRLKYEGQARPKSLSALAAEDSAFAEAQKSLQNRSFDLFGISLRDYLRQQGILASAEKADMGYSKAMTQALDDLRAVYAAGEHGDYEQAMDHLGGIELRRGRGKRVVIHRALDCDEELQIPYGVEGVRSGAFDEQSGVRRIEFSETCVFLEERAFAGCDTLEEVVLPEGLETLEAETFADCGSLRSVVIPASVKLIRSGAFRGCTALEHVELQNPQASVFEDAFEGCPFSLPEPDRGSVQLEFTVDKKNRATITGFSGAGERIEIPALISGHPVVAIAKDVFAGHMELREIILPDTVTAIPGDAFRGCTGLERLHLSNSLSKMTSSTFAECRSLREVNIPNAMTEVKRGLFKDCPVELLQVPKNTQRIDSNAFYHREYDPISGTLLKGKCMRRISIDPDNPWLRSDGTCLLSADGKTLLADLGDIEEYEIPEGVERVGNDAFAKNQFLHSISFPASLRSIGAGAFAETGLASVNFNEGLKRIEEKAFSFCRSLEAAPLPEGLEALGNQAFEGCPVREIRLPASLKSLGSNCYAILSLYQGEQRQSFEVALGNDLYHSDGHALYWAEGEERILLKAFDYEFRSPTGESLPADKSYELEPGTTAIGNQAFSRCDRLVEIKIPDSLRTVGQMAFLDCRNLQPLSLDTAIEIGPMAFAGTVMQ